MEATHKTELKALEEKFNKETIELENRHARELSAFQAQLTGYMKTVEALKLELTTASMSHKNAASENALQKKKLEEAMLHAETNRRLLEFNHQREVKSLREQVETLKTQMERVTTQTVAATPVLEEKEKLKKTLEEAVQNLNSLKQENALLSFKLNDLHSRYSVAQTLIDNNATQERNLNSKIHDLEKSLSRMSNVSDLDTTVYQNLDDMAVQLHINRQKLEEKQQLERKLTEKIKSLEEEVKDARKALDFTEKNYEKKLKDMKNTCDKLHSKVLTENATSHQVRV